MTGKSINRGHGLHRLRGFRLMQQAQAAVKAQCLDRRCLCAVDPDQLNGRPMAGRGG